MAAALGKLYVHSLVRLRNASTLFGFLGSAAEDPELHCSDQMEAIVGSLGGSDAREALTLGGVGSLGCSDAKEVPELKCTCHDNTRHALLCLSVSLSVFPCLSLSVSLCRCSSLSPLCMHWHDGCIERQAARGLGAHGLLILRHCVCINAKPQAIHGPMAYHL